MCILTSNFSLLSLADLSRIVASLNAKCNVNDTLYNKMLKQVFQVTGHAFLNLVNVSLNTGRIPVELKLATIVLIRKLPGSKRADK